jgi:hypothetical protein
MMKSPYIIAVDGRCAAGKTTFAREMVIHMHCPVIQMDHFFLQRYQRTEERLAEPGGNVDRERFQDEVINPLVSGESFSYRIFDCQKMEFGEWVKVESAPVVIVEGAYSCHPAFQKHWNLKIFLDVDPKEQIRRIRKRNGEEKLSMFIKRWIPLEEAYFSAFYIKENSDIVLPGVLP